MQVTTSHAFGPHAVQREFDRRMPLHRETRIVPYTAEQMFAVVAAVENYPEFLPWCSKVVVHKRDRDGETEYVTAEMFVSYLGFRESYVSRVELNAPALTIEAKHVKGPFKKLDTRWRFVRLPRGAEVHFLIDFQFSNPVLQAVAGAGFGIVAARMQQAFISRADSLYGETQIASSNS